MAEPPPHLQPALEGRYSLERELGAGGMVTVYLAHDRKHGRKVAIKVLKPELAAVIGAERFLREIQTIATLQHPHILGLIDSGEVHGTAYYVRPFVEGESLRDRLRREKQLPIADAVRLACEIAAALDYAHRHGIIHRDIKPENTLLHDGSALVADFGIALAASKAGGTRITETGMLLGEPPFTGPTAQAIVAKVLTEQPPPLAARRRSVPADVEDVAFALGRARSSPSAVPLAFGQATKVTWDPGLEVLPAISPDGSRVLFLERGGVVSVAATGGTKTAEVPPGRSGPVMSAAWAPDGRRIAYVVGDSIFVREAGGDAHGIARALEAQSCAWHPDGGSLACSSGNAGSLTVGILFGNGSPSRIVSVRLRDGRVVALSDSVSANQGPIWSPDGRWLYYVSNRFGPRDVFAQAVRDGAPRGPAVRLTTGLGAHTISLSADGRRLAYAGIELESNA